MTKKNLLFILHLPPPIHGAAMVGKYIQNSPLINTTFDADYINLSTSESLEEIGKAGLHKITSLLAIQKKVVRALRSKQYDLVYMTLTAKGAGFYKDVLVVSLLKLFNKKIIFHFHNKGIATQTRPLHKMLYRFVFKNTTAILLSKYLYPDIQDYVKEEHIYYCPNGIPVLEATKASPREAAGTSRLLFLSNMMEEKGVYVLLEACTILKERNIAFECHFVGAWSDVTEEAFKNKIAAKNLAGHVYAHGKKYGEEKQAILSRTDMFIFPTYYHNEAFALVILEAMQAGLPVITTSEGGIAEAVVDGETGFIIPKRDPVTLANKMEYLIHNPDIRQQMGAAGKRRFHELYTLEKFENNLNEILLENVLPATTKRPIHAIAS